MSYYKIPLELKLDKNAYTCNPTSMVVYILSPDIILQSMSAIINFYISSAESGFRRFEKISNPKKVRFCSS